VHTVAVARQDLRSKVFRSSAEGVGLLVFLHIKLAQAEVAQCDMSVIIEENVLRFQVSAPNG
jgi:hypothetical protein